MSTGTRRRPTKSRDTIAELVERTKGWTQAQFPQDLGCSATTVPTTRETARPRPAGDRRTGARVNGRAPTGTSSNPESTAMVLDPPRPINQPDVAAAGSSTATRRRARLSPMGRPATCSTASSNTPPAKNGNIPAAMPTPETTTRSPTSTSPFMAASGQCSTFGPARPRCTRELFRQRFRSWTSSATRRTAVRSRSGSRTSPIRGKRRGRRRRPSSELAGQDKQERCLANGVVRGRGIASRARSTTADAYVAMIPSIDVTPATANLPCATFRRAPVAA